MEDKLVTIKAAIAAACTAIGAFLGWKGIMALAWVLLMALDYFTGYWIARKQGTWKSSIARDGALHKGGMILVVLVAGMTDIVMSIALPHIPVLGISWPEFVFPLVIAWYILTELGSLLENAEKMGARVPKWLIKLFRSSLNIVENAGAEIIEATSGEKDAATEEAVAEDTAPETEHAE